MNNTYDPTGLLTAVGTSGNNIINIGPYNAAGEVLSAAYANGMKASYAYNEQLQLASILYSGQSGSTLSLVYGYGGIQNNGQVQTITDKLNSSQSTAYVYDEIGRLKVAQTSDLTSANTWKLKFGYDRYGNRLSQIPVGGTGAVPINQVLVDPTTNRINQSGYLYDVAGNLVSDGLNNYVFDAESRLTAVSPVPGLPGTPATFVFDAEGLRIKQNGNVYIYSGTHPIAEYSGGAAASSPSTEYVYAEGGLIASISGTSTTYYYRDHLSNRLTADASGSPVGHFATYPFGEQNQTSTSNKWAFTTYERDLGSGESGLDYARARFYSSRLGRFLSKDPRDGDIASPQSLNRYAYVENDPMNGIDLDGRDCIFVAGINTPAGSLDSILAQFNIQPGIYTYDGGKAHGISSVVRQDAFGVSSRTSAGAAAINRLDPSSSNTLFGYSGGAQIVSKAVSSGQVSLANLNVTTTIYLSPGTGLFSSLPRGTEERFVFHANGPADRMTTLAQTLKGNQGVGLNCSHGDLMCILNAIKALVLAKCHPHIDVLPAPELPADFLLPVPVLGSGGVGFGSPGDGGNCGDDCGDKPRTDPPKLICRDPNGCTP